MAKLTEEQKAANKAYRSLRHAHFSARYKAYTKARGDVGATVESSHETTAWKAANAAGDALIAERERIRKDFDARIEALKVEMAALIVDLNSKFEDARRERNITWDARHDLEVRLINEVDEQYPDMAKYWLSRTWVPPADIQALIDAGQLPESRKKDNF